MDKIYSRPRIKFIKIKPVQLAEKRVKKAYFTIIILIISLATGYKLLKAVDPIFEGLCLAKAQGIATDISNRKSSDVLLQYDYKDTVQIIKAEDGKNSILKTDIVTINRIISDIAIEIQKELNELGKQEIKIPVGALTGNQYLAGFGPNIKIKVIPAGDIATEIKTEFKSAGINQIIYRIYLNLECNVSILTAYKTINKTIENQVLLVETVVVGEVPETYLNLEKSE